MKAKFIVSVDYDFKINNKKAGKADVRKMLRDAVKERFQFLASTSVKDAAPTAQPQVDK